MSKDRKAYLREKQESYRERQRAKGVLFFDGTTATPQDEEWAVRTSGRVHRATHTAKVLPWCEYCKPRRRLTHAEIEAL